MSKLLFQFVFILTCAMAIFSMITDEQAEKWRLDLRKKCSHCRNVISNESFSFLDDDAESDDGDIRLYRSCVGNCIGYIKSAKLNINKLMEDLKLYAPQITTLEIMAARTKAEMCKIEAEKSNTDSDVIGRFYNCLYGRIIYDI